jgi:hypothetical protein
MNKLFILLVLLLPVVTFAQEDDLLSLLGEEEQTIDYATASFKTSRIINAHSLENTAKGVLDMKISHRFGFLNTGMYELFGLDGATMRFGFDYGINDRLMVGWGRSTVEKAYDGFVKYKILRQSTGEKTMPITLAWLTTTSVNTLKWQQLDRENYFSSRLSYTHQIIVGRKFSEAFTAQIMPTVVHRNLVKTAAEANDVYALGVAFRQKLTKRIALNGEYFYVLPNQLANGYVNSMSLGFDIETGGHVFQLHFTNSTAMTEKGFITETSGNWLKGDVHFGFNVSRVFTLKSE